MKRFILSLLLLCMNTAHAEDLPAVPAKAEPQAVTIVNGRKFFSMRNAKHFSGTTTPSGLLVIHHMRPLHTRGPGTGGAAPLEPAKSADTTPVPGDTSLQPQSTSPKTQNDILSVFAPDEKSLSPSGIPATAPAQPSTAFSAPGLPWANPTK